jgi:hypothetical protein
MADEPYFQVLTQWLNKKSSRCDIMFNEPVTCISFTFIVKSLQFHYLGTYVVRLFSPQALSINFYPVLAIDDYYKSSLFRYIPCCSYLRQLGPHLNYFSLDDTVSVMCYLINTVQRQTSKNHRKTWSSSFKRNLWPWDSHFRQVHFQPLLTETSTAITKIKYHAKSLHRYMYFHLVFNKSVFNIREIFIYYYQDTLWLWIAAHSCTGLNNKAVSTVNAGMLVCCTGTL